MDRSSFCSVLSTGDRRVDRQARLSGNAPSSAATRGLLLSHPPEPFTVPRAGGNERRNPNLYRRRAHSYRRGSQCVSGSCRFLHMRDAAT
jgi:hypothetical protein